MNPKWDFPEIAYGGDYNPEQWDENTLAEDFSLMRKAGVNLVSLGIFSWAKLEPYEGKYDFSWLLKVMDGLYEHGIYVDLATATASPPAWMAADYPETLPRDAANNPLGFGSRQQYCPNNSFFRARAAQLVAHLVQVCGKHPSVKLWHVNNELACHISECFCDNCVLAFRRWLEGKYDDINNLNSHWGTDFWSQRYQSFAQVSAPRQMPTFPNPGQMLDWRRFMSDSFLELYLQDANIIRKYCPNIPITTNFMGVFKGANYRQWAEHIDIISDDSYPDPANPAAAAGIALEADLARSYRREPFLLMEQAPVGMIQWRAINSPKRPGQHRLWSIQRLAQGADGILHFQWRQSKAGAETFHAGMLPHAGENSRIYREICQLGADLKKLRPVLGSSVKTKIAIAWEVESEWCREYAVGPQVHRFAEGLRRWHRSCFELGFTVDLVPLDGSVDLGKYGLVIVPECFGMTVAQAEYLQVGIAAGATVLVAGPSAVVDLHLNAHLENLNGPLAQLTGVRVVEHWPSSTPLPVEQIYPDLTYSYPEPSERITAAVSAPSLLPEINLSPRSSALAERCQNWNCPTGEDGAPVLRACHWAELIEAIHPQTEVLAVYTQTGAASDLAGKPAITRLSVGGGCSYYVSADLNATGRMILLQQLTEELELHPPLSAESTYAGGLPPGLQIVERGPYRFLLNHGNTTIEMKNIYGVEVLSGAEISGSLSIAPLGVKVLEAHRS